MPDPKRIRDLTKTREYSRRHYEGNKPAMKARAKEHNAKTRARMILWIGEYLAAHPCLDCGETDPVVMEFDHRDPSTKLFSVSSAMQGRLGFQSLKDEVAKCDVRCANCHRRKTYRERGFITRG